MECTLQPSMSTGLLLRANRDRTRREDVLKRWNICISYHLRQGQMPTSKHLSAVLRTPRYLTNVSSNSHFQTRQQEAGEPGLWLGQNRTSSTRVKYVHSKLRRPHETCFNLAMGQTGRHPRALASSQKPVLLAQLASFPPPSECPPPSVRMLAICSTVLHSFGPSAQASIAKTRLRRNLLLH